MPSPHSATRRIASGTAVSYLGFFLGKIIVFLNTVVLARLLLPEHVGLVAIGLLVLAVSETIAEAGTGAAIGVSGLQSAHERRGSRQPVHRGRRPQGSGRGHGAGGR